MEVSETDLLSLHRALNVLKPYLGEIILVGGWVPFLYRKYGSMPFRHPSIRTTDIDMAVPRDLPEQGQATVDGLLIAAGYNVEIVGSYGGAVKYELATPPTEIEFITPEVGRAGQPSITVQAGLRAQALRYVDILLDNTRQITVRDSVGGQQVDCVVKVPTPAAFIYQKALTLMQRRSKAAKDLYYIFDLVDSSPEMQMTIPADMKTIKANYSARWFSSAIRHLENYFPEDGGRGPALIAEQYTGNMPAATFRVYVRRVFRDLINKLRES